MNNLNGFQSLSIVGLIFSVIVQIILILINKHVDTVWALYPTWVLVFILGFIIKKLTKEGDHHHHH
jgi:hypothetical protein